ncbi:Retrovirus-related Pol polyprotein from transposon TNT 1-94 [Apostasia shenzhenica]|uniref:Retrovirus-related Pol polyprotein from transposon TNT 1-94 n=1 Tax=Apostasia shenzhenica TaxID=1088818 RepID=A0A2I0AY39_9ASPA|nr:Retrovirus-related Pol polyprotein from transposon TNT 1-94 [Apostasia shenzhenica]
MKAKSHKLSFSSSTCTSTSPLELIYSDIWGPAPIISNEGFSYYVIFVDDFSKFTWLFPMKRKSDLVDIFLSFQKHVERFFNCKIRSFHSDWGGEYQALHRHLNSSGITHRVSCPHTPEQNGSAERKHRHIIETTLALLQHASAPQKF